MGIFNRSKHSPGGSSQPEGDGPVTLGDRTEPSGEGSPDTNQARTEPLSPTPDHPEPAADVPTLDEMNVGVNDPQSPSHTSVGPAHRTGDAARSSEPGAATAGGSGTAFRAPGSLGEAPAGEAVGTDVDAGADRMRPHGPGDRSPLSSGHGDTATSPATGDGPLEGSSEQQAIVTGVRTPDTV